MGRGAPNYTGWPPHLVEIVVQCEILQFSSECRGGRPSLYSTNLTFFNVKLRPNSVNLKIVCKRAPSFFKTCIRHCFYLGILRRQCRPGEGPPFTGPLTAPLVGALAGWRLGPPASLKKYIFAAEVNCAIYS